MLSDWDLITLQAATLYRLDPAGRLLAVNEAAHPPAPRLFIGRTLAGDHWLTRHDLSPRLVSTLVALLAAEPTATDLRQVPDCLPALITALTAAGTQPTVWHGPAWTFPPTLPPLTPDLVEVTRERATLLMPHFVDLIPELAWRAPVLALVRGHHAIAVCFSARNSSLAAEAGLETAPPFRGHGYGPRVTAAWAAAVRATGRIPLYSTSWDNLASQAVARKLGLRLYGADLALS